MCEVDTLGSNTAMLIFTQCGFLMRTFVKASGSESRYLQAGSDYPVFQVPLLIPHATSVTRLNCLTQELSHPTYLP